MPDGQNLLVSRQHNGAIFSIWRHALKSSSNPERLAEGGVDAIIPATGRHTRRIAWVHQIRDLNIYRIAASGTGKPTRLIASTPARSGRGVRSGRSHCLDQRSFPRTQIWIARGGGSNQTQVTSMNGPRIDRLRWSFDGRYLAFESRPTGYSDIFVVECPAGILRCRTPRALNRTFPVASLRKSPGAKAPGPASRRMGSGLYFADRHDDSSIFRIPGSRAGQIPGSRAAAA